jgi:threonine dehydratase
VPIPSAVAAVRELVHDMVAVEEDAILDAVRLVRDTVGLLVEPAAAVGVAAVMTHGADRLPGDRLATILTGANITAALAASL